MAVSIDSNQLELRTDKKTNEPYYKGEIFLNGWLFMSNYAWYIKSEYKPAQEWYRNGGENWIKQYINNYDWVIENYDLINLGVYRVTLNNITAYIGEAVKVSNRLVVHAWHLANEPEKYYGVLPEEIKNSKIGRAHV